MSHLACILKIEYKTPSNTPSILVEWFLKSPNLSLQLLYPCFKRHLDFSKMDIYKCPKTNYTKLSFSAALKKIKIIGGALFKAFVVTKNISTDCKTF